MIHILDPSRSVEGNFVQYTVATTDGRVLNGLLASETKTAVELLDAEGKRQVVLREDIDEMAASKKSLMPEGFEKQVPPEASPTCWRSSPSAASTCRSTCARRPRSSARKGCSYDERLADRAAGLPRLVAQDRSRAFRSSSSTRRATASPTSSCSTARTASSRRRCRGRSSSPADAPAKAIHFLSGVSGWGYPGGENGPTSR